jgi:bla regulator protein blaR1
VEPLLNAALSNALVATGLAVVAAGAGRFCRRPALVHALWVLVLVKLVTPPLVPVPVHWPGAWMIPELDGLLGAQAVPPGTGAEGQQQDAAGSPTLPAGEESLQPARPFDAEVVGQATLQPEQAEAPSTTKLPAAPDGAALIAPLTILSLAPFASDHRPPAREPAPDAAAPPADVEPVFSLPQVSWSAAVTAAWLAGSALWLGLAARRVVRFRSTLRCARPAPDALRGEVRRVAGLLGLSACPAIWLVPGRVSPLVWALGGRPCLFLPSALWGRLTKDQRDTLLAHELAHLRRHDHWVRVLELAACSLYWWHPVVWWASRRLREAEEQCCDAWVVWALPVANRAYATALVEVVDFLADTRTALPAVASGVGHVHDLKRRLIMIMRGTTPRSLSTAGLAAVLVLAATLLPLVPIWGQEPQEDPTDQKQEKVEGQRRRSEEDSDRAEQKRDAEKRKAEQKRLAEERRAEQDRERQRRREAQRKRTEEQRARVRHQHEETMRGQETAEMRRFESDIQRLTSDLERRRAELRAAEERLGQARKQLEEHRHAWESRMAEARRQEERARRDEERARSEPPAPPTQGRRPPAAARRTPPPGEGSGSDQDRRLRDLERRLDGLLDEIRSMRREMRRPGGQPRESGRPGAGPGARIPGEGAVPPPAELAPVTPAPVADALPAVAPAAAPVSPPTPALPSITPPAVAPVPATPAPPPPPPADEKDS